MVNKQALHRKVYEHMESEIPQLISDMNLYHIGKRDAYLNIIADLQSGEFDNTEVECLRSQVNNLTALLREAGVMEEWIKKALSNNELNCT